MTEGDAAEAARAWLDSVPARPVVPASVPRIHGTRSIGLAGVPRYAPAAVTRDGLHEEVLGAAARNAASRGMRR